MQGRLRRRLLRCSLAGADTSTTRLAADQHLHGELFGVIRTCFLDRYIIGYHVEYGLRPFLQAGLGVAQERVRRERFYL